MSPKGAGSSSSTATNTQPTRNSSLPYSRRSTSQPKSSRQQFSACGACRMRRVRCDLKDLPIGSVSPYPACSNCKERGIKCVDEFADVKAVKLLRRGRRLQQVEAIYGKTTDPDGNSSSSSLPSSTKLSSTVPMLHCDFFASPFWQWFVIQRPILDAVEFPARYAAHCKGSKLLGNEGQLISMLLVVWAVSFGLDERGKVEGEGDSPASAESQALGVKRRQRKTRTEVLLHEIMEQIDFHGVLRRPTLDGVRVLLLLLPLLEEAQPLERLAIYEATLSQVQALCVLSASTSPGFEGAAIRARIFWYAYTQEGITTGIRGGRFVLNNEDLDAFQRTLPPPNFGIGTPSLPSPSSPSSNSNFADFHLAESGQYIPRDFTFHKAYIQLITAVSTPLDLSNVCRRIHSVLTGIKATRRAEHHGLVDANGMRDIWRDLDRCWEEFESEKRAPLEHDNVARRLEKDLYTSGWQIFIFECHNVIREGLKHLVSIFSSQAMYAGSASSRPSSHSSNSSPYLSPQHLLATATRKCMILLPCVIRIIQVHASSKITGIFHWDAGLVRDGCFFAGYLAANIESDVFDEDDLKQEDVKRRLTVEDGVSTCLAALTSMRWSFSKSEEREEAIRMIWEDRKMRRQGQSHQSPHYNSEYTKTLTIPHSQTAHNVSNSHTPLSLSASGERPPPLNPHMYQRRVESAPSTAGSSDGRGMSGWPSYSPPSTATSVATSAGTGISGRGSPIFSNLPSFKGSSDDVLYHGTSDLDHFSYHAPLTGPAVRENSGMTISAANYAHRHSPVPSHGLTSGTTSYLADNTFNSTNPSLLPHSDFHSCPQFGENCNCGYH